MKNLIFQFFISGPIIVGLGILLSAGPVSAQLPEKTLGELKADLVKIEKSIEITRQKMKEVKDVSFIPDLYFVLAELYVDKGRYLYAVNTQQHPQTPMNELDFSDTTKAKKQAIEVYQRFIENFTKSENLDKAHFFMAHEYRELGQIEEMVKIYSKITHDFPKSKYWEEAQLILGDYFLEQKKEPSLAKEYYQKILERPPNPFMPTARYKLGWCYINENKFEEALLSFEGVITIDGQISLEDLPDLYKKSDVKRDALLAMVWPYSEQKKLGPDKSNALAYFERLTPNRTTLLKVLTRLTKRLMLKDKWDDAIPVYFRLMEITNDLEARVAVIDSFYEAWKKSKKEWPLESLPSEMARTLIRERASVTISPKDKQKNEKNWEIYLRDFTTRLQLKARETRREADYRVAIEGYDIYLMLFPKTRFSNAILLNQAETYFALRQYARAGSKYEELLRRGAAKNESKKRKGIFDSAIQSFALALKNQEKLLKLEIIESREGFRDLGIQFVKAYPRDPANAMIAFNIGRTYYDERDFDRAVLAFKNFINSYPDHKETTTAGQLIMDSFNQREDYEGLIKAGKDLIANTRVRNSQFKADIAEIIKQAEYRKIQDQVGDPKSRDYAKKLLGFAAKYQGSSLGDQALYEAFVSMKNKKDPQAYEPGEQLLIKHADSKYAKEVVDQMGQMALKTADYRRAAKYFETFARKYPKDPSSQGLMKNASTMRELLGDFKEAAEDFRDLGNFEASAKQYVLARDWTRVAQTLSARPSASLKSNYWMGLALFRQGQREPSKTYFEKAFQSVASTNGVAEDKNMAAHALYLRASIDLKEYQAIQLGTGDEAQLVKAKQAKLGQLSSQFNQVIGYGNGRWTIAALYELGRSHDEFAQFLTNASMPAGLNVAQQGQYKQLIAQQVNQFRSKAKGFFKACMENAEKFEVFTGFVKGCQSPGTTQVDEAVEERLSVRASEGTPADAAMIRKKLFDSPRDINLLAELAQSYLRNQDYAMTRLIVSRILEIKPNDAKSEGLLGMTLMWMNDLGAAAETFMTALKHKRNEPMAVYGLAALYRQFGFTQKFAQIQPRLKSIPKPTGVLHPWISAL